MDGGNPDRGGRMQLYLPQLWQPAQGQTDGPADSRVCTGVSGKPAGQPDHLRSGRGRGCAAPVDCRTGYGAAHRAGRLASEGRDCKAAGTDRLLCSGFRIGNLRRLLSGGAVLRRTGHCDPLRRTGVLCQRAQRHHGGDRQCGCTGAGNADHLLQY